MTRIVIGHRHDGKLDCLYLGASSAEAEAAYSGASPEKYKLAEMVYRPLATKRRWPTVPESGTEKAEANPPESKPEEPEKPKAKPSKSKK